MLFIFTEKMRAFLGRILRNKKEKEPSSNMKKYLIVGLGNPGPKYQNTRHNIGFKVLDYLAKQNEAPFASAKLADKAHFNFKGKSFLLIKPTTYMNLSGKALKHWLTKENIPLEHVLVITDDLNLSFGMLRLKTKGSNGGHNGLKDIQDQLQTTEYARLRFGISDAFSKGRQVDYVLGEWSDIEKESLPERITFAANAIISFGTAGAQITMNEFNGK